MFVFGWLPNVKIVRNFQIISSNFKCIFGRNMKKENNPEHQAKLKEENEQLKELIESLDAQDSFLSSCFDQI